MTRFYTSDTHFGHENVIKYCNRPFANAEEMDEVLIEKWNMRVRPGDEVIHLGDFAFAQPERIEVILKRLNGNIHLVYGNHDKQIKKNKKLQAMFAKCSAYHEVYEIDEDYPKSRVPLILCHYKFEVWNKSHHGAVNLYGHSHGTVPGNSQQLDVGTDCWDYQPVTWKEIKARLATLPKRAREIAREL